MAMDDAPRPPTLGERLAAAAGRMRHRHVPEFAWAAGFAPVLRRSDALSQSWVRRFDREENGGPLPELGGRPPVPPDLMSHVDGAAAPPPGSAETGGGQPLPVDVRARLREVAGPGADTMRVRTDASADVLARAHRADAVTVGTQVHVRAGRYRPDTAEGFALLAHEASHVTALLGRSERRTAPGGPAAEEAEAVRVEAIARRSPAPRDSAVHSGELPHRFSPAASAGPSAVPLRAAPGGPAPATAAASPPRGATPAPAAAAAGMPMRADTDRADVAAQAPFLDVEALRQSIVDDLMRRVRTDFERGG